MPAQQPAPAPAPAPTPVARDPALAAIEAQVAALTQLVTNLAGVQAAAAATAAPREQRPNTHPVCATCGRKHAGGDDECWVVHPEKVPSSMKFMFKNIHTKRASLGLPDLREKYPVA